MEEELLTVAEVAGLLRLNPQTLRNWIDAGSLPAIRAGRRVRIRRSDLVELVGTDDISAETLLTVDEVATALRLNPQTIRNAIADDRLAAVRIGRRVRVRRADFDAYVQEVGASASGTRQPVERGFTAEDFWLGTPIGANLVTEVT